MTERGFTEAAAINALTQAVDTAIPLLMDAIIAGHLVGASAQSGTWMDAEIAANARDLTNAILANRIPILTPADRRQP